MKKIIAGFVAGALFMLGASSFADGISMIGKKIQGEEIVTANGEQLPDKAVVVNGKSYAPVRAIAEAAGMDVKYGNGGIVLTESTPTQETTEPITNPVNETAPEPEQTTTEKQAPVNPVNWEDDARIKRWQENINRFQEIKNEAAERLSSGKLSKFEAEGAQGMIDEAQEMIDSLEKQIEERKAELQK